MADNLAARLAHRNAALTGRRAAEAAGVQETPSSPELTCRLGTGETEGCSDGWCCSDSWQEVGRRA